MLTADLLRYRIKDTEIAPRYITRKQAGRYIRICSRLISLFQNHTGKTCGELREALREFEGKRTDFKIIRGLFKLLEEKAEIAPALSLDFPAFRHGIFSTAQEYYPLVSRSDLIHKRQREEILDNIGKQFDISGEEVDRWMYGDLQENQILLRFETSYTPESLLKRYNLALAQGLLYRANHLRIHLKGDYRVVFQYIKLSRLIHWIRPSQDDGMDITLDGPASLFRNSQRYGIRMANFLPGLLLAQNWSMIADIQTADGLKYFRLDSNCGLTSHYTSISAFDSSIEEQFFQKFSRKDRGWEIRREDTVINLGDAVFIPDFTFYHPDGRIAHLEIIGFWTPEYLEKKIDKIRKADHSNLILAINKMLNCSRKDFRGEVLFYRTGIRIGEVLEALERKGC
ncbi:MAG: DUF790 family protein [bacterium]